MTKLNYGSFGNARLAAQSLRIAGLLLLWDKIRRDGKPVEQHLGHDWWFFFFLF